MSPLVKKEIRLLLPSIVACCALGLTNLCFRFDPNGSLQNWWLILPAFLFCGAMAVMLALNSFGAEISSGTFSNLLAQPISRQKIWDTKILLLAISLLVVGVFWTGCGIARLAVLGRDLGLLDMFTGVGAFALVVFSGGLWTVLLLRQIAAAFWFTVLVPGCILVILAGLFADHSPEFIDGMTVSVLGLYSLAGFFFARRLFFRAQDLQWTGGVLVLPEMRGLSRFKFFTQALRTQTPRAALWRKEIQLHQSQFVIAFMLLVLHIGVIVTRHFGHFRKNSTTEFILEGFWVLWLVMPLLVGCAAVAEERRLGTHESQLCLPVKRRTQFLNKFMVVILLSIALGTVMPWLLEGSRILPDLHFEKVVGGVTLLNSFNRSFANGYFQSTTGGIAWLTVINLLVWLSPLLPFLLMAAICASIAAIAFYTSTLARNTLQTLAPAAAGIMLAWFLIIAVTIPQPFEYTLGFLWHGPLPYFIVFPVIAVTLLMLAYGNYRRVWPDSKLAWRNLLMLASVFGVSVALTSAIYHRAWEKLTPFEPPHGPARLTLANPASLNTDGGSLSVRLPDGRIWTAGITIDPKMSHLAYLLGNIRIISSDAHFWGGSNWLTVNRTVEDLVGIKQDGTLWVSEKPLQFVGRRLSQKITGDDEMRHLVQFGTESNWSSVLPWGYSAFLTKSDGTLWRWGLTNFEYIARTSPWPGLHTFTPERLSTESNWTEVFQSGFRLHLRKTDGSVWGWNENTNGQILLQIEPGFTVSRISDGQPEGQFRSTATISWAYRVGIRDDGSFRIRAEQRLEWDKGKRYGSYRWYPTDLQIGTGTNWLGVAGEGDQVVTLKNDGTLWLWDFDRNLDRTWESPDEQEVLKTVPVPLGTHSDWIAISSSGSLVTTLAADGSLWFWPTGNEFYWGEAGYPIFGFQVGTGNMLLDISRKPQLLGNIFSSAR